MNSFAVVHIVSPAEFDPGTAQTPGSDTFPRNSRKTAGRKPYVFPRTLFKGPANMEQSWTNTNPVWPQTDLRLTAAP
jgi:hypothetical protein